MASAPAAVASEAASPLALATAQVFLTLKLLDYFGTVIFAIAGTLTAIENRMDLVGSVILVGAISFPHNTRSCFPPLLVPKPPDSLVNMPSCLSVWPVFLFIEYAYPPRSMVAAASMGMR